MDILSILGVIIGFSALIGGNFIEGGSIYSLINGSAALRGAGGALGAALSQTANQHLRPARHVLPWVIRPPHTALDQALASPDHGPHAARKEGLLGFAHRAEADKVRFARKGLQMLVNG